MEGRVLLNEQEHFYLSLTQFLQHNTLSHLRSTTYEVDDEEEEDNSFVFNIEQSLLVDLGQVYVEKMIGEGSYSVVHQGLWVFYFFRFRFLAFLNLFL